MKWISIGAVFSGTSVLMGAMGAHSLKNILTEDKLNAFQTATDYMGYHGLALILVGIICIQSEEDLSNRIKNVGILFISGIFMFSGSIYVLTFNGPRFFGPITPIGGLCFIIGWFILARVSYKKLKPISKSKTEVS